MCLNKDMFLVAMEQDIPICRARNINDHAWIDSELRYLIKSKDEQRRKAMKTKKSENWDKFKSLRRRLKTLTRKKRFEHDAKLNSTLHENPKHIWKYIKSMTKLNTSPNVLRDGQTITIKPSIKVNMLNNVFQSVVSSGHVSNTHIATSPMSPNRLTAIQ